MSPPTFSIPFPPTLQQWTGTSGVAPLLISKASVEAEADPVLCRRFGLEKGPEERVEEGLVRSGAGRWSTQEWRRERSRRTGTGLGGWKRDGDHSNTSWAPVSQKTRLPRGALVVEQLVDSRNPLDEITYPHASICRIGIRLLMEVVGPLSDQRLTKINSFVLNI